MSVNLEDALADLAAEEISGIRTDADDFAAKMRAQQEVVEASQQRILDALGNKSRKQPEYPDNVKAIANMLVAYPNLIPVIQAIITKFLKRMQQSFDELAAEYMKDVPPPEETKQ